MKFYFISVPALYLFVDLYNFITKPEDFILWLLVHSFKQIREFNENPEPRDNIINFLHEENSFNAKRILPAFSPCNSLLPSFPFS